MRSIFYQNNAAMHKLKNSSKQPHKYTIRFWVQWYHYLWIMMDGWNYCNKTIKPFINLKQYWSIIITLWTFSNLLFRECRKIRNIHVYLIEKYIVSIIPIPPSLPNLFPKIFYSLILFQFSMNWIYYEVSYSLPELARWKTALIPRRFSQKLSCGLLSSLRFP